MELRGLRHFVAVVDARSFTEAAHELQMSQPALSQSIARLENDLECTLIDRNRRHPGVGLQLTAAGTSLYADARALLAGAERARERARRAQHGPGHVSVSIGFTSSTPRVLLKAAIDGGAGSAVDIVPVQMEWGNEHFALVRGTVDLAYLQYPIGAVFPEHDVRPVARSRRVAVLPHTHRLAPLTALTIDHLSGEPILDPGFADGPPGFREFWLGEPRPSDSLTRVVGPPARTVEEMCTFVVAGRGIAIASEELAGQYQRADVVFTPVLDLAPVEVGLARLADDERTHVRRVFDALVERAAGGAGVS